MKKYRAWIWGIVLLSVGLTIALMLISPQVIAMHYNASGAADSWASRWGLWLAPLILAAMAGLCDRIAWHQRNQAGLTHIPVVLVGEWRNVLLLGVAFLVLGFLQLKQIGL